MHKINHGTQTCICQRLVESWYTFGLCYIILAFGVMDVLQSRAIAFNTRKHKMPKSNIALAAHARNS